MELAQQASRNDPCWCGSGKKYKKCHLVEDEKKRAKQALVGRLQTALTTFALSPRYKGDFEKASEFFLGFKFVPPTDAADQEKLSYLARALDYYIHDYPLAGNQRLIERFAVEQGKQLTPDERALLKDWTDSRPALYEILEVRRGEGLRLRDLVSGDEYDVREKRGSEQANRWDILFTRVMRTQDHYEIGGYGLAVPARFRGMLRSHAESLWSTYRSRHEGQTYADFLHSTSQLLNQFILDEIEPRMNQAPMLVTMEGDLLEQCTATFEVLDYPLALAGLRAAEEFAEYDPTGPLSRDKPEEKSFGWQERGESLDLLRAHGPAFEYQPPRPVGQTSFRSLGRIVLARADLKLETTSRRRLAAGKELLTARLGSCLAHLEDRIESIEDLRARAQPETAPAEKEQEPELSEELEAWQAEFMAEERRQWLDESIPVLDGQTPRAAVRTLAGRVRVIRLLKEIEGLEQNRARAGSAPYDYAELKKELGLTDQDFVDEMHLEDRLADELQAIEELAHQDRVDDALGAWRAFRQKYPLRTMADFEFAQVRELDAICDRALHELLNRLTLSKRYVESIALAKELSALDADAADD